VTLELIIDERNKTMTTLRFIVSDTGVGLSIEEKDKIFQRFSQVRQLLASRIDFALISFQTRKASRYTSVEYGGSGLGLFISKNLARLMGGDISVESEKWKVKYRVIVL